MPKKLKAKKSSKTKFSLKNLLVAFIPVFLGFVFIINQTNGSVLGISDTNFLKLGSKTTNTTTPTPTSGCKPMISAISLSSPCTNQKGEPGFKSVTYTCADGTTGASSTDCLHPQQALDKAGSTCSKNSNCKPSAKTDNQKSIQTTKPSGTKQTTF